MRVVVTVKTYPNPSTEYIETVCVAGIRIDPGAVEWVRLYPVPFRLLSEDLRFKKYAVLEVQADRHVRDRRPESRRPVLDDIREVDLLPTTHNWARRKDAIGSIIGATTTCELQEGVRRQKGEAPSLGCVRFADIDRVYAKTSTPWSDEMKRKAMRAADGDLFREGIRELQQPPFESRFRYRCETPSCSGHDQKTLDWEAEWFAIRWTADRGRRDAERLAVEKWESLVASDKDAAFFIGNQNQHPGTFSILGNWYPKKEPATLF